jgi:hypothetical protein
MKTNLTIPKEYVCFVIVQFLFLKIFNFFSLQVKIMKWLVVQNVMVVGMHHYREKQLSVGS